jgi:hypothetical protein
MIKERNERKTVPWTTDEYAFVDGLPCVYEVEGDKIKIRMRGVPKAYGVTRLRQLGFDVQVPKTVRTDRFC